MPFYLNIYYRCKSDKLKEEENKMTNNKNTQMTVEDKKQVEAVNFTFKFRNSMSKFRN